VDRHVVTRVVSGGVVRVPAEQVLDLVFVCCVEKISAFVGKRKPCWTGR